MRRRQTIPRQWLITDERFGGHLLATVATLPRGSGVLVRHHALPPAARQRLLRDLHHIGRQRGISIVDEAKHRSARVHNAREIRQARLSGVGLLFVSPLFATRSHPDWQALRPMRAAALARLAGPRAMALGGMNARRFARVRALGFYGWAGIDAWMGQRSGRLRA